MTQLALWFIGLLATLSTLAAAGLVLDGRADRWTRVAVSALAAILWGMFALSSFDVVIDNASYATSSEPILPLVYTGVILAAATGIYTLAVIVQGTGAEASETDPERLMGR